MTVPARRPLWKKKRWRLAFSAWLAFPVVYPLSLRPVVYLDGADRLPDPAHPATKATYGRVISLAAPGMTPRPGLMWYLEATEYFYRLGGKHASSD